MSCVPASTSTASTGAATIVSVPGSMTCAPVGSSNRNRVRASSSAADSGTRVQPTTKSVNAPIATHCVRESTQPSGAFIVEPGTGLR